MADGTPPRPPDLNAAGEVFFASPEDLRASGNWLRQGALLVVAEVPLPPLEELEVRLSGGGLPPLTLRGRPVTRAGEAVLLELLDLDPATVALFARLADVAGPIDAAAPSEPAPPIEVAPPPELAPPIELAAPVAVPGPIEPSAPQLASPWAAQPPGAAPAWPDAGGWDVGGWSDAGASAAEPLAPEPAAAAVPLAAEAAAAAAPLTPELVAPWPEAQPAVDPAPEEVPWPAAPAWPEEVPAPLPVLWEQVVAAPIEVAAPQPIPEPAQVAAPAEVPWQEAVVTLRHHAPSEPAVVPAAQVEISEPAAPPAALPILEGDLLRFLSVAHFDAALQELRTVGAVLAAAVHATPKEGPHLLGVGYYLHPVKLAARVRPTGGDTAVLQFEDRASLLAELARIEQATSRERSTLAADAARPAGAADSPQQPGAQPAAEPAAAQPSAGSGQPRRRGVLDGQVVRYAAASDLLVERDGLLRDGALQVLAPEPPALHARLDLTIEVAGTNVGLLHATCMHLGSGLAGLAIADRTAALLVIGATELLQLAPVDAAGALGAGHTLILPHGSLGATPDAAGALHSSEGRRSYQGPTLFGQAPVAPPRPAALVLPPSGPLRNPTTPEQLLAQALAVAPGPELLVAPSGPLLLRSLQGRRRARQVTITVPHGRPQLFVVADGTVSASLQSEGLARLLAEAEGKYELHDPEGPTPTTLKPVAALDGLLVDVLALLLHRFPESALATGLGTRVKQSPALTTAGRVVVGSLRLNPPQERLAARFLDGKHHLDELVHSGAGIRSAWELLYLLELHGALVWGEPPARVKAPTVDPVEQRLGLLSHLDAFAVLGLHWSCAPRQLEPAYRKLLAEHGPGSPAASRSPAAAARIVELLKTAHAALASAASRTEYRKKHWPDIAWGTQAELLVQKARLLLYREELDEAQELVEGAQDVLSTPEGIQELARIAALRASKR